MLVYEAMGETLKHLGVTTVFGLMGDGNMDFVGHWSDGLGLSYYAARHEGGAAAMADGFSRASNKVGVCSVTHGPGVTNTMTALTEAVKGSSPVLLVAGDTPTRALRHNQDIDQAAVLSSVGVGLQRIRGPATAIEDVARAYNRALLEQRPIALSVPTDVQSQPCPSDVLDSVHVQTVARPRPDDAAIKELSRLVGQCQRPVIFAGRGAARSGGRKALEALGERIGALLVTTVQAKGLFSGHPLAAGLAGGFASEAATHLLEQADLVLVFGASLNSWSTRNRRQFSASAKLVHIDTRPAAIGALTPVDVGLIGDAVSTADALTQELERTGVQLDGFRSSSFEQALAQLRAPAVTEDQSDGTTVDPRVLMSMLDKLLPAERTVVVDSGHAMGWSTTYLSVPDANAFIFSNDFQAVGLGLGTAFGAAIARPERLTVLSPGDGGMMMGLPDLETVARCSVPMLVVVINDCAYGPEVHMLRNQGKPVTHAVFPDVDFAAVARAFGARALTVRKPEELEGIKEWLVAPRGPMVLDCKVSQQILGDWFKHIIAPGSWFQRARQ